MAKHMQNYQVEVVILILNQSFVANLRGIVKQLEGRINNQILEIKGPNVNHDSSGISRKISDFHDQCQVA